MPRRACEIFQASTFMSSASSTKLKYDPLCHVIHLGLRPLPNTCDILPCLLESRRSTN